MPLDDANEPILDPAHDDTAPTTVVAGRPSPAPSDVTVSEDENLITRGDKKYVREEALYQERQARQQLTNTFKQLEPLMPDFQEFLAQKNARQQATSYRTAPPTIADDEYTADELEGLAHVRGYYKADHTTPDLDRARQELHLMSTIADRRAGQIIRPVDDAAIHDRAEANYRNARTFQMPDGDMAADQKYIDAVFSSLSEKDRADPNTANLSIVAAAGLEYLDLRRQGKLRSGGRVSREPTFREGSGGNRTGFSEALDELDRAAARARGKTPEQWAQSLKAVGGSANGPGRPAPGGGTILEDV